MKTDEKTDKDKVLEEKAGSFLLEALVARTSFSNSIKGADEEIRGYLLERKHIKKSGETYFPTQEGRGYAAMCDVERELSAA